MEDWRLRGQENYLSNVTLYRVHFPEFWQHAYKPKNLFYQKIVADAHDHVKMTGNGAEFLEGEKVQEFWHEHCDFCHEKANTHTACEFYCTADLCHWICAECFKDFAEQFHWQVKPAEELFND